MIYQCNPDEAWKCVKFEGGLRKDVLAVVKPMEIRDYAPFVNKCRLVEEYNEKLGIAKSNTDKKRLALENQGFEYAPPPKKQLPSSGYEGKSS